MRTYAYIVPWLVSHFAAYAAPTDGASLAGGTSRLIKRAPKEAGIGVELEVRSFILINNDPRAENADGKMVAAVKGSTLFNAEGTPDFTTTCAPYWDLTAELVGSQEVGIRDLTFEWIVRGEKLKMMASNNPEEDLVLPAVGTAIKAATKKLDPKEGSKFYISTTDYADEQWGPWTLVKPKKYSEDFVFPGTQVTTGLPIEAIQELISILKGEEDLAGKEVNSVAHVFGPPTSKRDRLVLITAEDMEDIYEKKYITTDMLGFYSLLMSYVNIAATSDDQDRAEGPKHRISIMPRTDFKTLYAMYGNDESSHKKSRKTKRCKKTDKFDKLIDIIKHLAEKKNLKDASNIEKATFKWTKPNRVGQTGPPPPPPRGIMKSACKALNLEPDTVDWQASWSTKNDDYNKGELSIGSWVVFAEGKVDPLPIMENLLRGGQVGGLGDRVEKPLYPGSTDEDAYALYELRDLSSGSFTGLENFLTRIERQVKNWHHNPPKYEELKNNLNTRALGAFCKKPNDDKKCKDNEVENAQGKCEACKSGEKPDPLKTKCISEKDDKPNDKPADNNDDDKRFREKKEGKWEETKKRMKDEWNKKKQEQQDKDKEEEKTNRRKQRIGSCLCLVSASMMSVGAGVKRADNDFKYAINYFSEEYIDSDDALKLLPSGFDEPGGDIESDEYVNEALKAIDSPQWITSASPGTWQPFSPLGGRRAAREARRTTTTDLAVVRTETGVTVYNSHNKRFLKALMTAISRFLEKCTAWLVRGSDVVRLKALKEKGGFKVAEKGKGANIVDQRNAGNQITKSKNWRNCLEGKKFEGY